MRCQTCSRAARTGVPELLLATRLSAFEAVRKGFGVSANDFRQPDLTEPIRLVKKLLNTASRS